MSTVEPLSWRAVAWMVFQSAPACHCAVSALAFASSGMSTTAALRVGSVVIEAFAWS